MKTQVSSNQFHDTIAGFDKANARDPNLEKDSNNQNVPKELLYAQRMSAVLEVFCPDASESLQLAARAQHIERWKSPRTDFPEGRSGYKKWRSQLSLFHAQRAAEIMREHGYGDDDIDRVKFLVQKRQLKRDNETQTLEDVICLVFLQFYLNDFAAKHSEEKLVDILQKTWKKMSPKGHETALKLPYSEEMANLLKKNLR